MKVKTEKNRKENKGRKQGVRFYLFKNLLKKRTKTYTIPEHLICKQKNIRK